MNQPTEQQMIDALNEMVRRHGWFVIASTGPLRIGEMTDNTEDPTHITFFVKEQGTRADYQEQLAINRKSLKNPKWKHFYRCTTD